MPKGKKIKKELEKNQLPKKAKWIIGIVISFIFVVILITNSSLTANFADDVLRPTIGAEKTLALESIFFNLEDNINQLRYKLVPPSAQYSKNTFTQNTTPANQAPQEMNLSSIPLYNFGFSPLNGEGIWQPVPLPSFPKQTVMARTFIRTDPKRSYAIVNLIKIDMKRLKLDSVAGIKEPGGKANPGSGKIPSALQLSGNLVAAFNGGFQEKDGHYGMIVRSKTYLPLLKGLASLVIDKTGKASIIDYEGQNLGSDNLVIRQNGGMLVKEGVVVPSLNNQQYGIWGRTVTNSMYTWRSGLGITKDGDLIYAVGPSLIPTTLGEALREAGAVNAMQLDINPYWVRFVIFEPRPKGGYQHFSPLKDMYDGGAEFLKGYQKDFFYLYKK